MFIKFVDIKTYKYIKRKTGKDKTAITNCKVSGIYTQSCVLQSMMY